MTTQTENNSQPQILLEQSSSHLKTVAHRAYSRQRENGISDEQITQLIPMVHKIVRKVVTYLKPPLTYEDMVSAGTIGLVKAARDYDPFYQADFKTYAYIRTRGAVIDELRGWSFVPAAVEKKIRKARQLSMEITEKTGFTPTDEHLAQQLGISINALYKIYESTRAKNFISIDNSKDGSPSLGNLLPAISTTTPDENVEKKELIDKLTEAIKQLNEKQRRVIILYYQQQLTMKQIAQILNITEPRVSQLHASALFNLSTKLEWWKNGR